jgi:hypothetical protein
VWVTPGGSERPWDFRHGRRSYQSAARGSAGPAVAPLPAGRLYRCHEIGSHAQAQELLRKGNTYLDGNGDGEACVRLWR